MNILREVEALNDELIQLRRDVHQHPELGFEEFRTAEVLSNYLRACGLEPRRVTPRDDPNAGSTFKRSNPPTC